MKHYSIKKSIAILLTFLMLLTAVPFAAAEGGTPDFSVCGTVLEAQQSIPAKGHTDADSDGKCDSCGAKINGLDDGLCKWCGKDHSGSFWQKIVGFFHRIFYFFAHLFGIR